MESPQEKQLVYWQQRHRVRATSPSPLESRSLMWGCKTCCLPWWVKVRAWSKDFLPLFFPCGGQLCSSLRKSTTFLPFWNEALYTTLECGNCVTRVFLYRSQLRDCLSFRWNIDLLKSIGIVEDGGTLMLDWMHFALWDGHKPRQTRGQGLKIMN